jgi:DNA-binding MarR family transcriptional regulator
MNTATQTTEGFNAIFIHSSLDDAGLTTQEFRVFAHISRRAGSGRAWAGNKSMSEICQISHNTIDKCLSRLEGMRMVTRMRRPGKTTIYTITPPGQWVIPTPNKGQLPEETQPTHPKKGVTPTPNEGQHPTQTRDTKDIPLRISKEGPSGDETPEREAAKGKKPKKPKPERIGMPEFIAAWHSAFEAHHHGKYLFRYNIDGPGVTRLLKAGIKTEEIIAVAQNAWLHPTGFFCKQAATVAGLASRWNEIRAELQTFKRPSPNPSRPSAGVDIFRHNPNSNF